MGFLCIQARVDQAFFHKAGRQAGGLAMTSHFRTKSHLFIYLLLSSKNAFIMQSKSTFLEFLRGIHRYKFGHPKKFFRGEIIQGE